MLATKNYGSVDDRSHRDDEHSGLTIAAGNEDEDHDYSRRRSRSFGALALILGGVVLLLMDGAWSWSSASGGGPIVQTDGLYYVPGGLWGKSADKAAAKAERKEAKVERKEAAAVAKVERKEAAAAAKVEKKEAHAAAHAAKKEELVAAGITTAPKVNMTAAEKKAYWTGYGKDVKDYFKAKYNSTKIQAYYDELYNKTKIKAEFEEKFGPGSAEEVDEMDAATLDGAV